MNTIQDFFMSSSGTIADALRTITENKHGVVIVVDEQRVVTGIVSDGDIRRAMLKGAVMFAPVSKIMNIDTTVLVDTSDTETESEIIFEEHPGFNVIPVVDEDNRLAGVVVRRNKNL